MTYYHFDAADRMVAKVLPNGCITYCDYDHGGRLVSLANLGVDLGALSTFAYTFDSASNITAVVHKNGDVQYCSYDSLDRITCCDWRSSGLDPIYSFEYDYDSVGNRLRAGREFGDTYYTYNQASEMVTEATTSGVRYYDFDASGHQTAVTNTNGSTYFRWNAQNMIERVDLSDGGHEYFYYDGALDLARRDNAMGTTEFTWDELNLIVQQGPDECAPARLCHGCGLLSGTGSVLARGQDGECRFYQQDHTGSTVGMTTETGGLAAEYSYGPYGESVQSPADRSAILEFAGKLRDEHTDQYYFHHRQYDPSLGRFTSRDPFLVARTSPYVYCRANPFKWVDPDGRAPVGDCAIATACPVHHDPERQVATVTTTLVKEFYRVTADFRCLNIGVFVGNLSGNVYWRVKHVKVYVTVTVYKDSRGRICDSDSGQWHVDKLLGVYQVFGTNVTLFPRNLTPAEWGQIMIKSLPGPSCDDGAT